MVLGAIAYTQLGIWDDGDDFFVSYTGSDMNDGSQSAPWRSIGRVNTALSTGTIKQGDNVYFECGGTYEGGIDIITGGTADNYMVFGNYGDGPRPIFISERVAFNIAQSDIGYIRVEGFELHMQSTYNPQNGQTTYYSGYRCRGPYTHDLIVKDIFVKDAYNGIIISDTDGFKIEGCYAQDSYNSGIAIYGGDYPPTSNGLVIDCISQGASGNDVFCCHANDARPPQHVGSNIAFINCEGRLSNEQAFDITSGSNIYVKDCYGHNNPQQTMVLGHGVHEVVVDGLLSENEVISVAVSGAYDVALRNSILKDNSQDFFTINADSFSGTSHNIALYHNNMVGSGALRSQRDYATIISKNNIFKNTASWFVYFNNGGVETAPFHSENNVYWRDGGVSGNNNWGDSVNVRYTLAEWNALPLISGEQAINPLLGADDLITSNSPCVGAGTHLTVTTSAGSGNTIPVENAVYFYPGLPYHNIPGDTITVGDDTMLVVTARDMTTNTITVDRPISWNLGDEITLRETGTTPDIGVFSVSSGPNPDVDGDGINDADDNCPFTYNPNQEDSDGDGDGDRCDNCPETWNPNQEDADNDGIGDACETVGNDYDNDGVLDGDDNCPAMYNPDQEDWDKDGIGDACDYEPPPDVPGFMFILILISIVILTWRKKP